MQTTASRKPLFRTKVRGSPLKTARRRLKQKLSQKARCT